MSIFSKLCDFFCPSKANISKDKTLELSQQNKLNEEKSDVEMLDEQDLYEEPKKTKVLQKPDGLDLNEYIMLRINPTITPNTKFPDYWNNTWNTKNPKAIVEQLVSKGFYTIASPREQFDFLKLTELKNIAKNSGLKISGKKEDLINRIVETLTPEQLKPYLKNNFYVLSDKGKVSASDDHFSKFLLANKIELFDYMKLDNNVKSAWQYKEFLLSNLDNRISNPIKSEFYANNNKAYELLIDMGKQDQALPYLVRAYWCLINGCFNYYQPKPIELLFFTRSWLNKLLNYSDEKFFIDFIPKYFVSRFRDMKKVYGDNFFQIVKQELNKLDLPKQFIAKTDGIRIIQSILSDNSACFRSVAIDIGRSLISEMLSQEKKKVFKSDDDYDDPDYKGPAYELIDEILGIAKDLKI